jgi:hypothetical protein
MRSSLILKVPIKKYKLFCPSTHLWIHATQESVTPPSTNNNTLGGGGWKIDVGITDRGLDDIGDISSIEYSSCITNTRTSTTHQDVETQRASKMLTSRTSTFTGADGKNTFINHHRHPLPRRVKFGDEILKVHWDGHLITRADELYHTVWETVSDTTSIRAPLDGILYDIYEMEGHPNDYEIDSHTPLFTLWTDHACIHQSLSRMMQEEEYNQYVTTNLENGRFFDPDHIQST